MATWFHAPPWLRKRAARRSTSSLVSSVGRPQTWHRKPWSANSCEKLIPDRASRSEAVDLANNYLGPDTITFAEGVSEVTLTHGQLTLLDDVTIAGPEGGSVTIEPYSGRTFEIDSTATVEFSRPGEGPPSIDRYDLIEEVGRGGMGIVYQAHDRRLDREQRPGCRLSRRHAGAGRDDHDQQAHHRR